MKTIDKYIQEKLIIDKNTNSYNYHPKDKGELQNLVRKLIEERGNEADLNDIDVSKVTSMNYMFFNTEFNGDISKWEVINVTSMYNMFGDSPFNGDISKWNVSNVKDMSYMFYGAKKFNQNISNWKVSNDTTMEDMFKDSPLEKNPPKWYHE